MTRTPNYYNLIRHEFCAQAEWHPVSGCADRPFILSRNQFLLQSNQLGMDWWNWTVFDAHVPSQSEMIEDLEFRNGTLFRKRLDGNTELVFSPKPIRLEKPVLRIAKHNAKNGKQTIVRQFHLPIGNPIDKRIVKSKSVSAHREIMKGMKVSDALRHFHIKWDSLVKYSDYQPKRLVLVNERVNRVKQKILDGTSLQDALSGEKMSSATFWRRTGGFSSVLASRTGMTTDYGSLEW